MVLAPEVQPAQSFSQYELAPQTMSSVLRNHSETRGMGDALAAQHSHTASGHMLVPQKAIL